MYEGDTEPLPILGSHAAHLYAQLHMLQQTIDLVHVRYMQAQDDMRSALADAVHLNAAADAAVERFKRAEADLDNYINHWRRMSRAYLAAIQKEAGHGIAEAESKKEEEARWERVNRLLSDGD